MWRIIVTGLLAFSAVQCTTQCNIVNFGLNAGYTCGLQWWQSKDMNELIKFEPKLSQIVFGALAVFNVSVKAVNEGLTPEQLYANSSNPLAKIIESGLAVEPYITYAPADLIQGFEITAEQLAQFGLPSYLANKQKLMEIYTNYFTFYCGSDVVAPALSCMKQWLDTNCNAAEDKTQIIKDLFDNFQNYYCSNGQLKGSIKQQLDADLGQVYRDLLELFGIYKDTSSPYLFNLNITKLDQLFEQYGSVFMQECGFLYESVQDDVITLSAASTSSNVGAGEIVGSFLKQARQIVQCSLRVFNTINQRFLENHPRLVYHISLILRRYGLVEGELNWKPVMLGERRSTVTVFGDPHMITYNNTQPVTCSALGNKIYVENNFFSLQALAEPAVSGSIATYATAVNLTFKYPQGGRVEFFSGIGDAIEKNLTFIGVTPIECNVTLDETGSGIRIIDRRSGAVFQFAKYRNTYYFTVRAANSLLESSSGLLITGCKDPIDIQTAVQDGRRRKRSTSCETACSGAPADLQDSCIYDCTITGDTGVANITSRVKTMQAAAIEKDAEIQSLFLTPAPPTSTSPWHFISLFNVVIAIALFQVK